MTKNENLSDNLNLISDSDKSKEQTAVESILRTSCFLRHEMETICQQFDLTKSQYFVLKILHNHPDALPRCEIIDKMIEPSPDVTRLIDKLEENGLVERYRSDKDARMSMSRITDRGLELFDRVNTLIYSYFQRIGDLLTEEECFKIAGLCKRICECESDSNRNNNNENVKT